MKKLIATLLVLALAIPAMAADVSLTDNADGTGTIVLTVGADEVVRGLAIVVDSAADITTVTDTDAIFNVFMDAAYDAESASAGSYVLGAGSPVANPAAAGGIALPAASISLCMGVLDESGAQGGAAEGTYIIGVVETCGVVTITADTLRGGIVGDAIVAGTIAGGEVTCDEVCVGNITGSADGMELDANWNSVWTGNFDSNGQVDTTDLSALVNILVNEGGASHVVNPVPAKYAAANITGSADGMELDANWNSVWTGNFDSNDQIDTTDLSALVNILVNEGGATYTVICE